MGKLATIFFLTAFATIVMGLHESLKNITADSVSNVDELWDIYKKEFNKTYEVSENADRKQIFEDTLKRIHEHNALYEKGESSYTLGINQFADKKASEHMRGIVLPSDE